MGVGSYGGYAQDAFRTLAWAYLLLVGLGVWVVWVKSKTVKGRRMGLGVVLGLAALPVLKLASDVHKANLINQAQHEAYMARYRPAKALFDEKCKGAGLVVHRTVEGVEGLLLLKTRPEEPGTAMYDPMFPWAAVAGDGSGDGYIHQFLLPEYTLPPRKLGDTKSDWPLRRGDLSPYGQHAGYQYVVTQGDDGIYYRHTVSIALVPGSSADVHYSQVRHEGPLPRYALDFEDWVDPGARKHWVAGSTIKVIDMANQEVMASLIAYRMSRTFGEFTNSSIPWSASKACPELADSHNTSRFFVDQIVKPKTRGE